MDNRIDFLDSTRGIAAIIVVILHVNSYFFVEILNTKQSVQLNILNIFFNGIDAVSYFFVLSGFVLSYKFLKTQNDIYESPWAFTLKRIFRIFPLYAVIVLASYILYGTLGSKLLLFREFILFPGYSDLVKPGWSLSVEMCISLFVPIIIFVVRNNLKLAVFMLFPFLLSYSWVTCFLFHFTLGVLLALAVLNPSTTRTFVRILITSKLRLALTMVVIFTLFSLRFIIPLNNTANYLLKLSCDSIKLPTDYFYFYLSGIASATFILLLFQLSAVKVFLSAKPLVFIGKVSFGIYLIHHPLITIFEKHEFYNRLSLTATASTLLLMNFSFIVLSVILATVAYYTIEEPFIKIGKRAAARLG